MSFFDDDYFLVGTFCACIQIHVLFPNFTPRDLCFNIFLSKAKFCRVILCWTYKQHSTQLEISSFFVYEDFSTDSEGKLQRSWLKSENNDYFSPNQIEVAISAAKSWSQGQRGNFMLPRITPPLVAHLYA